MNLLEDVSFKDGSRYNESLMFLHRGGTFSNRSILVESIMYDLWRDMCNCDQDLANNILEPISQFLRFPTNKERPSIKHPS